MMIEIYNYFLKEDNLKILEKIIEILSLDQEYKIIKNKKEQVFNISTNTSEKNIKIRVDLNKSQPEVRKIENSIEVYLTKDVLGNSNNFIFQLSHELIHAFYGNLDIKRTNNFEEAYATYFSLECLSKISSIETKEYYINILKEKNLKYYNVFEMYLRFNETKYNSVFVDNLSISRTDNFSLEGFEIEPNLKNELEKNFY